MNRIDTGTVVDLAMPWEMIGTGPNEGLVLNGDQDTTPLVFNGSFNIDYSSGTPRLELGSTITGDELFNVYLFQTGDRANQNPGSDLLVFIGSNRVISAVPEPSSLLLVLGTAAGLLARRRR